MALPTQWFNDAADAVNNAQTCTELQDAVNKLFAAINPVQQQITTQLALLAPLLVTPSNLAGCITWITHYIAYVSGPTATLTAQAAELTAAIANLTSAITNKANSLGCSGVTIP